jgi:hypothetical protein
LNVVAGDKPDGCLVGVESEVFWVGDLDVLASANNYL